MVLVQHWIHCWYVWSYLQALSSEMHTEPPQHSSSLALSLSALFSLKEKRMLLERPKNMSVTGGQRSATPLGLRDSVPRRVCFMIRCLTRLEHWRALQGLIMNWVPYLVLRMGDSVLIFNMAIIGVTYPNQLMDAPTQFERWHLSIRMSPAVDMLLILKLVTPDKRNKGRIRRLWSFFIFKHP